MYRYYKSIQSCEYSIVRVEYVSVHENYQVLGVQHDYVVLNQQCFKLNNTLVYCTIPLLMSFVTQLKITTYDLLFPSFRNRTAFQYSFK